MLPPGVIKHIRAVYPFNKLNGFSELRVYDTNAWDGPPKLIKI